MYVLGKKTNNFVLFPPILFVFYHIGGVTGRVLALFFVAHYKRASILVFSLVGVLSCSIFIYLSYVIWGKADFNVDSICG